MNKLPWMKYDPDIVSLDVDGMSLTEEGAYSRAVRHIWRNGPLPHDRLQRLCGPSLEAVILCMEERDGMWSFAWLEEARGAAKAWVIQRSEAGKSSAKKRASGQRPFNDRSTVVLSPSISSSISNSEENERAREKTQQTPVERFKELCGAVVQADPERLPAGMRSAFLAYWTEPSKSGKLRFECEKFFDVGRRMDTWRRNEEKRSERFTPPPPSPTVKPWIG